MLICKEDLDQSSSHTLPVNGEDWRNDVTVMRLTEVTARNDYDIDMEDIEETKEEPARNSKVEGVPNLNYVTQPVKSKSSFDDQRSHSSMPEVLHA